MMLVYSSRQHTAPPEQSEKRKILYYKHVAPPEQLERNTDSTDLADQDAFRSFYTNSHIAPPEFFLKLV